MSRKMWTHLVLQWSEYKAFAGIIFLLYLVIYYPCFVPCSSISNQSPASNPESKKNIREIIVYSMKLQNITNWDYFFFREILKNIASVHRERADI